MKHLAYDLKLAMTLNTQGIKTNCYCANAYGVIVTIFISRCIGDGEQEELDSITSTHSFAAPLCQVTSIVSVPCPELIIPFDEMLHSMKFPD